MKLRYIMLAGALMVSAVGLIACGSTYSCSDKGSCANDVAPTQAQIDACNKTLGGVCASQNKAFGQCGKDNTVCGADGKSTLASGKCGTELAAIVSCCIAADGGC